MEVKMNMLNKIMPIRPKRRNLGNPWVACVASADADRFERRIISK